MTAGRVLEIEPVGDEVFRLPVPIPFEVGPVNCYLIRRGEPALIDCGPKTDEAYAALLAHLAALGVAPAALRHIVATHSHIDHHGALARLCHDAPEATVHVHEDDAPLIFEYESSIDRRVEEIRALVRFWGFPEQVIPLVDKMYLGFKKFADSVGRERYAPIRGEEDTLDFGGGVRLRAIHTPGHTEGLVCLHLAESGGLLFANDHILERITPNPTVYMPPYRGRRTGLADYIASLERLRGLRAARILPGHGPAFGGLERRIEEILAHHRERKERIVEILRAEKGRRAVIDLALTLWPAIDPPEYYLACREMHGHLELLESEGRVRRRMAEGGIVAEFDLVG